MKKRLPYKSILERMPEGLYSQVAKAIGLRILQGTLVSGQVLPNEATLASEFGVSRTALREAIKVLASKGLIEVRRKTGTRIRLPKDWHYLDPDVLSWQFSDLRTSIALDNLLELRRLIEPAAARFAALRATAADCALIQESLNAMESMAGNTEEATEVDLLFHLAVLDASHNIYLHSLGVIVKAALRASFQITNADAAAYRRSLERHRALWVAIEKKDPQAADRAMCLVLDQAEEDIGNATSPSSKRSKSRAHEVER